MEQKYKTVEKIKELLMTVDDSILNVLTGTSGHGDLEEITIYISGGGIIKINVKGDSPMQIVKDVLNTVWSLK